MTTHPRLLRNLLVCLGLIATVFALYLPVRNFEFLNYDDQFYIYQNAHVLQGLTPANLKYAFTTTDLSNYHPLIWISFCTDVSVFGLKPGAFHLENVLLHGINAAVLFLFLLCATKQFGPALFGGAIFAVHPAHLESVAWISERKDVLSGLFFMLGLLAYSDYVRQKNRTRRTVAYLLTLASFALGLLAKPMLVTFPFALLLLDIWPFQRNRSWRRLIVEKIPMFVLILLGAAATLIAQKAGGAVVDLQRLPISERLANALLAYVRYVGKIFWPNNLSVFYPRVGCISISAAAASAVLLVLITIGCIRIRKKMPHLFVGWFLFLGMLVPVIGLVQVGWQSIADRYLYLPIIGPIVMIAFSGEAIRGRMRSRLAPVIAACALVLLACIVTAIDLPPWHDTRKLFEHAITATGPNAVAQMQLGYLDSQSGNNAGAQSRFEEAVRIEPDYFTAQFDLANLFLRENEAGLALPHYQAAARIKPELPAVHLNWGIALMHLDQPANAFEQFATAIKLDPNSADAHYNLGQLFRMSNRLDAAMSEFQIALMLRPDHHGALTALASTQAKRSGGPHP